MKRLAILGAGGHGKVIADLAELLGWDEVVFFDDGWPGKRQNGHWPVQGNSLSLFAGAVDLDGVIVGIGNNRTRELKTAELHAIGLPLTTLIHPSAQVSRYSSVGYGSVAFANSCVHVDTVVGIAAILNTGSSVDHDCRLADAVHVCPGARLAGNVTVGARSWIGIGASVRQQVEIGADVVVGAGAAVICHIADGKRVVGVPAREMEK